MRGIMIISDLCQLVAGFALRPDGYSQFLNP